MHASKSLIAFSSALFVTLASFPALAHNPEPPEPSPPIQRPPTTKRAHLDVVFVLDTTSSMSGLIAGAKQKIWSIASEMAESAQEVRFGLVGFRDRGDEYITQRHDLTGDIDKIYGHLQAFSAQGGGDGPESVNQAFAEAVSKMSWSRRKDSVKMIFLVGDAPPHMDYDEVKYPVTASKAKRKGIIVNTIQCGQQADTTQVWRRIASAARGDFFAIQQSGGAVAVVTPFDEAIATTNRALNGTVVAYGSAPQRQEASSASTRALSASPEAAADRMDYLRKSKKSSAGSARVIANKDRDVVALLEEGELSADDIEEDKLPATFKAMSKAERRQELGKMRQTRRKLQGKLNGLLKKRASYIKAEAAKKPTKRDSFDHQMKRSLTRALRKQTPPSAL